MLVLMSCRERTGWFGWRSRGGSVLASMRSNTRLIDCFMVERRHMIDVQTPGKQRWPQLLLSLLKTLLQRPCRGNRLLEQAVAACHAVVVVINFSFFFNMFPTSFTKTSHISIHIMSAHKTNF